MKITGGRQVNCHTNTRGIYEITGGRQVHCHTNTRRIYENYRWEAGSLSHKYKTNIWKLQVGGRLTVTLIQEEYIKLQVGGRFTVTHIQDEYMKITGGRQVHCHTNTRRIYENYRWEAGPLSHKYKRNIWKLQVGGRFTVTQIQDEYMKLQVGGRFTVTQIQEEYMKITGGRQVHCHTNTRRIYENYRWEAGPLSHKYKRNIWKLQVGGRFTVTQIQDEYMKLQVGGRFTVTQIQEEYMKITGGRQVHCHTNKRGIYENYRLEVG